MSWSVLFGSGVDSSIAVFEGFNFRFLSAIFNSSAK